MKRLFVAHGSNKLDITVNSRHSISCQGKTYCLPHFPVYGKKETLLA